MHDPRQFHERLDAELLRLGLDREALPGAGLAVGGNVDRFIERLRALQPGVTWHDVFPDLPKHWIAGRPETWTVPYVPYGPFDYQELPTAPTLHVSWKVGGEGRLEELVRSALSAGWKIYGAGVLVSPNERTDSYLATIVLLRGAAESDLLAFGDWVDAQPGLQAVGYFERVSEDYLEPRPPAP